jgi:hypothetical protein
MSAWCHPELVRWLGKMVMASNMQSWTPRPVSRPVSGAWLLAVLFVLHSTVPAGHSLGITPLRPLLAALVPNGGPMLRPFGLSDGPQSVQAETRPLAAPPDRAFQQDSPVAIVPISIPLSGEGAYDGAWAAFCEKARSKTRHLFEARGPPTTA